MDGSAGFGEVLQRHRHAQRLTQAELAEKAGLSERAISDLERGLKHPQRATVRLLIQALGLPAAQAEELEQAARTRVSVPEPMANETARHNLPAALTSFVGREHELGEVRRLLSVSRLVTLTGSGGVGKTRLALKVAERELESFGHSVWFVELASLAEPALVVQAVAQTLGVVDDGNESFLQALESQLRAGPALLVLDNCEHLVEACAELADTLLRSCSELHILATSRETLRIVGETTWRVPSLTLPDDNHGEPVEQTRRSEAARLFVERVRAVVPSFVLTELNAGWIDEICRRLEGIPLALELAAARVSVLSVEQIAERLSAALDLLTVGGRTASSRHRTLRATLDWSYRLLAVPEQRLFERLSVFAGGCTLEAAETVCVGEGIETRAVLDLLGGLVAKSLVLAQPEASGLYRYEQLEVLRQYGLERLAERAESAHAEQRHAEYYLRLRYETASERGGTKVGSWQSERDNANIATALRWCVKHGKARVRRGGRGIILDPHGRVLLFRNEEEQPSDPERPEIRTYWFMPGGGAKPGESYEDAALREIREETGITGVRLGPCVWSGQYAGFIYGEPELADQHYFLVHTQNATVDTSGLQPEERSNWREFRWWTLEELRTTSETIRPEGFADLLEPLLEGQIPPSPINIFGDRALREAIAAASVRSPPDGLLRPREVDVGEAD